MVPNGMVVWFSYTSTSQHVFRALFGQLVFSGKFLQQDPSPTLDLSPCRIWFELQGVRSYVEAGKHVLDRYTPSDQLT